MQSTIAKWGLRDHLEMSIWVMLLRLQWNVDGKLTSISSSLELFPRGTLIASILTENSVALVGSGLSETKLYNLLSNSQINKLYYTSAIMIHECVYFIMYMYILHTHVHFHCNMVRLLYLFTAV